MKALVIAGDSRVHQVAAQAFRVAAPFQWVDCPADCTTEWTYNGTAVEAPPTPALADLVADRRAAINAERNARMNGLVTFGGHTYDADQQSRANLLETIATWKAALDMDPADQAQLPMPVPTTITWRDAGNVDRSLTYLEAVGLAAAMGAAKQAAYLTSWALKDALDALAPDASAADVAAITWPE